MKYKIGIAVGIFEVAAASFVGAYEYISNPEGVTFYPGHPETHLPSFILGLGPSLFYINAANIASLLVVAAIELCRAKKTFSVTKNIVNTNIIVIGVSVCMIAWLVL